MGRSMVEVARRTFERSRAVEVEFIAAGVAYYALVTLLPLLVLVFLVLIALWGETVAQQLIEAVGAVLSTAGRELLQEAVLSASGRAETAGIGLVVLLWGGLRLFRALDTAIDRVYGSDGESSFVDELRDATVTLGGVVLATAVVGVGSAVVGRTLSALPEIVAGTLVRLVVLVLLLFPIYYVLPEPSLDVLDALPGAVVTAGGWLLLRAGFDTYVGLAGNDVLYGVFSGLLLFVTLLYVASLILVIGVVVNVVLAATD